MTYRKEQRVRLDYTDDAYTHLKSGDEGVVNYVGAESRYGDPQQVGVKWDDGSNLIMLVGIDGFTVIK